MARMDLFTVTAARHYAVRVSPLAEEGKGPWGAAIKYWLHEKGMSQADLVRATELGKNTVSYAVRGLPTTTATLQTIADTFQEPIELVLVSPEWMDRQEHQERVIAAAIARALRELDKASPQSPADIAHEALKKDIERRKAENAARKAEAAKKRQAKAPLRKRK